ncbi:MAG: DUF3656 domain-containing U32 family peptidase [Christensenellales bacterium]|jgi:putative protease
MLKSEILSPAGNIKAVYQAVQNGADAIYIGGKSFGARAFADNFCCDEMKQAIDYAHTYGVKVYVTVNTLVFEDEIDAFLSQVKEIYLLGADALIMQDVGMIKLVRGCFPDINIHASTQMHNHNDASLRFILGLGIKRAVLAREMDLEQIKNLTCSIEKEVFIHGALCICYSGQCLMSALTKERSGNRGQCAQSCRLRYKLLDQEGRLIKQDGSYLLSPKDLALFEDINALVDAGIRCFKIEGRMKSPEYVGCITHVYAQLLKSIKESKPLKVRDEDIDILRRLFNRGFTKGHLFNKCGIALMGILRPNHSGIYLGTVLSIKRDRIKMKLDARLNQGDGIKFENSDKGFICNRIYKNGKLISSAAKGEIIELDSKVRIAPGETVVKTNDALLVKELQKIEEKREVKIFAHLTAKKGEPLSLTLEDLDGHSVTLFGNIVKPAKTISITKDGICKSVSRLGDTPYAFRQLQIDFDEGIFIAKSEINALRRKSTKLLTEQRIKTGTRRVLPYEPNPIHHHEPLDRIQLHVLVRNEEQFNAVKDIVTGDIYTADRRLYYRYKATNKNLRLKTDRLEKQVTPLFGERLLVTDHGGIHAYNGNNDIIADYMMNMVNSHTLRFFTSLSVQRIALSPELDIAQMRSMILAYQQANGQTPVLEALVYVRHELMAMQHCVISGRGGTMCGKCKNNQYYIEDIGGRKYPIVTDERCNNYILNSRYLQADIPALLRLGIRHFRVEMFDQNADQATDIIKTYLKKIDESGRLI